jgi:hypothetical protein
LLYLVEPAAAVNGEKKEAETVDKMANETAIVDSTTTTCTTPANPSAADTDKVPQL